MKFRAWDGEKWRTDFILLHDGSIWDDCDCPVKLKWKVVRSTGLTDKNGVEIWEGDIRRGSYYSVGKEYIITQVMTWDDQNACFYWKGQELPSFVEPIIIGNVFENREILEDKG